MIYLNRLGGEQAAKFWPILSRGFARSLPPGVEFSEMLLNNMLLGILHKQYDCWIIKGERDGKPKQLGGVITTVRVEPLTGVRSLLIYSLYVKQMLSDEEWKELFKLASHVATKHKCKRICAYTRNPSVLSIVESLGGQSEMRVVELEVKDGS